MYLTRLIKNNFQTKYFISNKKQTLISFYIFNNKKLNSLYNKNFKSDLINNNNENNNLSFMEQLIKKRKEAELGGGLDKINKQHEKGKLTGFIFLLL